MKSARKKKTKVFVGVNKKKKINKHLKLHRYFNFKIIRIYI